MQTIIEYLLSQTKKKDCPIVGIIQNFNVNESLTITLKDGTMIELMVTQITNRNKK